MVYGDGGNGRTTPGTPEMRAPGNVSDKKTQKDGVKSTDYRKTL
jgi:hypothetical protein